MLNGIRCDKYFTAVATVRAHPEKYQKDFGTEVTFFTQYINKRASTPSVKVAFIGQNRPAKQQRTSATPGTFKGKSEFKKSSRKEYDSIPMVPCQQLYEL